MKNCELISTGSELLSGRTVNRHAHFLGSELSRIGYSLNRDTTLPDDRAAISATLQAALKRVDIIFLTGGLGPTPDDLTREAVADVLGLNIVIDEATRRYIEVRFKTLGREMSPETERHALVLNGAAVLPNRVGLAPGELIHTDGKSIFLLPGPPRELMSVFIDEVMPLLVGAVDVEEVPVEKVFMLSGLGESTIMRHMNDLKLPVPPVEAGYCAAPSRVEVRFSALPKDEVALLKTCEGFRNFAGQHIFAEHRQTLEEAVGQLLVRQRKTIAIAESCTGGLLGHRLTSVPGSSAYFRGGVLAYANEVKVEQLGVAPALLEKEGAVCEAVACQMARGVRERFHSDIGVGVTGIAGPGGGSKEKPVGLVFIAVAGPDQVECRQLNLAGDRMWVKESSAQIALDMIRCLLI